MARLGITLPQSVQRARSQAATAWHQARTPARLNRLVCHPDPMAQRLASAIVRVRQGAFGEGAAWMMKIEGEREKLLRRTDPLVQSGEVEPGPYDHGKSIGDVCGASKGARMAALLYALVDEFEPASAVELGANLGISASYQAAAMEVNGRGHLLTLEASPFRTRLAQEVFASVGLSRVTCKVGLFADTLGSALREAAPVAYVFIDGHHQLQPTLDYFDEAYEHLADDAVVVFDDIRWSSGMREAWSRLQRDPRIKVAADLGHVGVCTVSRDPHPYGRHASGVILV